MVERALDAGVPAAWVVADEVYGNDGKFRRALEARNNLRRRRAPRLPRLDLAAVRPAGPLDGHGGGGRGTGGGGHGLGPPECGEGAQGPRVYDWAYFPVRPAVRDEEGWVHAVLVRRHPRRPDEVAFYLVYAPTGTALEEVVRAAGARWTIEDTFKQAKGLVGLDHYEVRSWRGWHRHVTLALLALATLTVATRPGGGLDGALPRPHPDHRPGGPPAPRPPPVGHRPPPARLHRGRCLVPLAPPAPTPRPGVPHPSPLEAAKGTVILVHHSSGTGHVTAPGVARRRGSRLE